MITAVRQLTLSIGTLVIAYAVLIALLHKTLTTPITKENFVIRHILIPLLIYGSSLFVSIYYLIPHRLKAILPIESSLVRNALADILSQSVGLSINFLCITAILCIGIDNLLYLYNRKRIPYFLTIIITLSLSIIAYNTFYVTLSRQKTEIMMHTNLIFKLFLGLEIFLSLIILLIATLIVSNYIKQKVNKI